MKTVPGILAFTAIAGALVVGLEAQTAATFENGAYRQGNVSFTVPPSWRYLNTVDAATPGERTAHWSDPVTGANLYVWMSPTGRSENLEAQLANAVPAKTQQRERQGYQQWRVRQDSITPRVVNGRQALFALADYVTRGTGERRVELLTWILSNEGRTLFFAFVSPNQLDAFKPAFDQVVDSTRLP